MLIPGEWSEGGRGLVSGFMYHYLLHPNGPRVSLEKYSRTSRDGYGWGVSIGLPGHLLGVPHDDWVQVPLGSLLAGPSLEDVQASSLTLARRWLQVMSDNFKAWSEPNGPLIS